MHVHVHFVVLFDVVRVGAHRVEIACNAFVAFAIANMRVNQFALCAQIVDRHTFVRTCVRTSNVTRRITSRCMRVRDVTHDRDDKFRVIVIVHVSITMHVRDTHSVRVTRRQRVFVQMFAQRTTYAFKRIVIEIEIFVACDLLNCAHFSHIVRVFISIVVHTSTRAFNSRARRINDFQ